MFAGACVGLGVVGEGEGPCAISKRLLGGGGLKITGIVSVSRLQ